MVMNAPSCRSEVAGWGKGLAALVVAAVGVARCMIAAAAFWRLSRLYTDAPCPLQQYATSMLVLGWFNVMNAGVLAAMAAGGAGLTGMAGLKQCAKWGPTASALLVVARVALLSIHVWGFAHNGGATSTAASELTWCATHLHAATWRWLVGDAVATFVVDVAIPAFMSRPLPLARTAPAVYPHTPALEVSTIRHDADVGGTGSPSTPLTPSPSSAVHERLKAARASPRHSRTDGNSSDGSDGDGQGSYSGDKQQRPQRHMATTWAMTPLATMATLAACAVTWMAAANAWLVQPAPRLRGGNLTTLADTGFQGAVSYAGMVTRLWPAASLADLRASKPTVITVCHPDWHGIRAATYSQGHPVLEFPGVTSPHHLSQLLQFFVSLPTLHTLIINGIPPNTVHLASEVKKHMGARPFQVLFVYHGAPSNIIHDKEAHLVDAMLEAAKQGHIAKLGLVKNGFAQWVRSTGVEAHTIWNFPPMMFHLPTRKYSYADGRRHVGVFGTGTFAKNLLTQVLAVCSLPNTVVHMVHKLDTPYLARCSAPIVEHGFQPHDEFVLELARMDVNVYTSLSECFPMVVIESISQGVPCVTSHTSRIYDVDPILQRLLTVSELDNPAAIQAAVEASLLHRSELSLRLKGLVHWLHGKATAVWRDFTRPVWQARVTAEEGKAGAPTAFHHPPVSLRLADPPTNGDLGAGQQAQAQAVGEEAEEGRGGEVVVDLLATLPANVAAMVDTSSEAAADARVPYVPFVPMEPRVVKLPVTRNQPLTVALVVGSLDATSPATLGESITTAVNTLLAAGQRVVVIEHTACDRWQGWQPHHRSVGLVVHCVPRVLEQEHLTVEPTGHPALRRSREVAAVVRHLSASTSFDVVECTDRHGLCYELLRARRAAAGVASGHGDVAHPYLPKHVPIMLYGHGTLQLEDAQGRAATNMTRLTYAMEQMGLELADVVWVASPARAALYRQAYLLHPSRVRVTAGSFVPPDHGPMDGGAGGAGVWGSPPALPQPDEDGGLLGHYGLRLDDGFVTDNLQRPLNVLEAFILQESQQWADGHGPTPGAGSDGPS